jgi:amino acid adenylation domain-containing protein
MRKLALGPALSQRLRAFAAREHVTLYMASLSAFEILLARYTDRDDIVVGTVAAGRHRPELDRLLGFFANPLVLRTSLAGDPTVREVLRRVRDTALDVLAHDEVPFEHVVAAVRPERDAARNPLFQLVFAQETQMTTTPPGWAITHLDVDTGTAKFDVYLELSDLPGGIVGRLVYQTDLFDAATIDRLVVHYRRVLEAMVADPTRRLSALPLLDDHERAQLLALGTGPRTAYPEATVDQVFEARAHERPQAVAVVTGERCLTYGELDRDANRLAHRLRTVGAGPGRLVGVVMDRGPALVTALLGVLKSGAAYVPLDPAYPRELLAFMLEDTAPVAVLTTTALLDTLPVARPTTLCLDTPPAALATEPDTRPDPAAGPDDLAYVMYTSGSTGRPKGVAVPHRAILRLLFGQRYARLGPDETLLQLAPVSFDASTFELWGALLHGGRCVLFPERVPTPGTLADVIRRAGVTTVWLTASLFNAVVDTAPQALDGLRQILTGGEALSPPHIARAQHRLPGTAFVNGYGPTEATTFACCYPIPAPPAPTATSIPIGRPLANTDVYVLDRWRNLVPVGVDGELYIGGAGLARGYWNRPELTAERFVPSPFAPGERLYRTGDLVRWRSDGTLDFRGRLDAQMKIRGHRVEPGEVEAALARHPAVREAAVAGVDGDNGKVLVAYVVPTDGAVPDATTLRGFLADRLPPHMIPSAYVALPMLPVTPNGKLDRRRLPPPAPIARGPRAAGVAPRTALEAQLARLWEDLLGVQPVGVTDDFFELGGNSLLAVRMVQQIGDLQGVRLPLAALYSSPTVERLAALLERGADHAVPAVVTLNAGGRRPPVFFFHGDMAGGGFYALRVARRLGAEQPVHVVHPLTGGSVLRSIEAMADRHLRDMRAVASHGPWRIVGYCNGGLVAYEIARQLAAAGEDVDVLALVAAAPNLRFKALHPLARRAATLVGLSAEYGEDLFGRFRSLAWRLRGLDGPRRLAVLGGTALDIARRVSRATLGRASRAEAPTTFERYFRAVMGYVPGPYPGRVILMWPEDEPRPDDADPTCGWRAVAARVDLHVVPGDHSTIVKAHALVIADALAPYLG